MRLAPSSFRSPSSPPTARHVDGHQTKFESERGSELASALGPPPRSWIGLVIDVR